MSISNISHALPPNPCTNPLFQPPIYSISNISVVKTFGWNYYHDNDTVSENFRGTFNFTVHDAANNYSLSCSWGQSEVRGYAIQKDQWGG